MKRWVATLLATSVVLAACGTEDESGDGEKGPSQGLLQPDDLPAVDEVFENEGSSATKTNCPAMDGEWNVATTRSEDPYVEYHLEDGTVVRSAVQSPYRDQDSFDYSMDRLAAMVEECVASKPRFGTFERLEGLPQDSLGFVATQPTSDGVQTTERVYVPLDEQRAVVLTVVHVGDGAAPVSVEELIPTALERAKA